MLIKAALLTLVNGIAAGTAWLLASAAPSFTIARTASWTQVPPAAILGLFMMVFVGVGAAAAVVQLLRRFPTAVEQRLESSSAGCAPVTVN